MTKSIYVCQACSMQYSKWVGQCKECQSWNTITEEIQDSRHYLVDRQQIKYSNNTKNIVIDDLTSDSLADVSRYSSGIAEFDRVLGGGFVLGGVILCTGEPGIGKSTLLLQISNCVDRTFYGADDNSDACIDIENNSKKCLYISGEESISQIKIRARRLGINNSRIMLITTTKLEDIIGAMKSRMKHGGVVIIDSIQTIFSELLSAPPGSVSQVRACTFEIVRITKEMGLTTIIVGHVTKEGQIAGPKVLEHMVDTVLSFEGDTTRQYRILRTSKNRYGSTNEIGIFEMGDVGLLEVVNPSAIFMSNHSHSVVGSCIFGGLEGTRGLMVEVQALTSTSYLPLPKRSAIGWDSNRLSMLIAILVSKLHLRLGDKDIYLNVVGGIKIVEPAIDLAVVVALISALNNAPIPHDWVFFGEVGLLGELRSVANIDARISEANKLGFRKVILPKMPERQKSAVSKSKSYGENVLEFVQVSNLKELYSIIEECTM